MNSLLMYVLFTTLCHQFLVLDEADRVLDVGFEEELRAVFQCLPKQRQTLLFSATMTSNLEMLLELSANKAYFYEAYEGFKTVDTLKQQYVFIPKNVKEVYLVHLLSKMEDMGIRSAMIFVSTCRYLFHGSEFLLIALSCRSYICSSLCLFSFLFSCVVIGAKTWH